MTARHISSIRSFNRFYTDIIGLLDQFILDSKYSLPEVRVLYEIYHHPDCTAKMIMESFHIDKGYLSRILQKFQRSKMIGTSPAAGDGRSVILVLTSKGKQEFERLDDAASKEIRLLLGKLGQAETDQLIAHMEGIKKILSFN